MRNTLMLFGATAMLAACDYVDKPFADGEAPPPPAQGVQRKVLLEEFTGHKCPTCPAAHVVAQQLADTYGDQLIIVSEHVTGLADPTVAPYTTNFHTPAGDAYFTQWPSDAIPRGLVSRTNYGGNVSLTKTTWSEAIAAILGTDANVKLWFDEFNYNSVTNVVTATVKCAVLNAISEPRNITIQLIEDHVTDYQYDGLSTPPDIANYDHRHVLRSNVNGTWGEPLITGTANAGDTISTSVSYTLPANVINASNCALVAYVYNAIGTTGEYEVEQVEERKLVP